MREITVFVKTKVKNKVDEKDGILHIGVRAAPKGGEANAAVKVLLAGYLSVPQERITLIRGRTSPKKVFTFNDN